MSPELQKNIYLNNIKKMFSPPFTCMCLKVSLALPNMEAIGQICVLTPVSLI